jgi:BirA family transcriptional regulator, biotin operon repressor / biotin---[acetyl-CoA-carboxylase] ligase
LHLAGSVHAQGFRLASHGRLASTNDEALACARSGDQGGLWVTAESQSGGRGRNGRAWASEPGNLFASLLLIDPAPLRRAPELGFVASVALALTLRDLLGGDSRLAIKWPNDILHDGAKVAGILLESASLPGGFACVVGIGVNCHSHPDVALYKATDLTAIAGRPIAPETVFEPLTASMAHWFDVWAEGAGFEEIRDKWLSLAAGVGAQISVKRLNESLEGVFQTIDPTGRLILQQSSGSVAIDAGDVFLLAPPQVIHQ